MKYKVGDKVRIRSKEWYDKHKDERGEIVRAFFDKDRAKLCGTIQTIANNGFIDGLGVTIYAIEDAYEFIGEEAIEGLAEDTDKRLLESAADACKKIDEMMEARYQKAKTYYDGEQWPTEFECPSGYQFKDENGNVINATKIVLEKKKKEYPKTYEECCKVLNLPVRDLDILDNMLDTTEIIYSKNLDRLLNSFRKILICRDAYWKIAGDWKPEYPFNTARYVITNSRGFVGKVLVYNAAQNYILEFPTEEMRDAFYENFKELIEQCKELL